MPGHFPWKMVENYQNSVGKIGWKKFQKKLDRNRTGWFSGKTASKNLEIKKIYILRY